MDQEARQAERPSLIGRATAAPLILLVQLYQVSLRHMMGGQCRFHPTCSEYALEALRVHGGGRGGWLTIKRLLRCHPLGGAGYDPVPRNRRSCRFH